MYFLNGLPGDLWAHYVAGGFAMHPITVCSILSLTVIVYKLLVFRRARMDAGAFISRIRASLLNGKIGEALETCGRYHGPVATTVRAGLLKYGAPRVEVESAMEAAATQEIARLERHLPVLSTITGIAPLLGFLGTVVGLILAFSAVAAQEFSDFSLVAHGFAVALHATAWGLIVAFVTLPFHHFFLGRVAGHAREIETASSILFGTFSEMERMGTKA